MYYVLIMIIIVSNELLLLIPYKNTLKNKSSINKLIISSHGMGMGSLSSVVIVDILITLI